MAGKRTEGIKSLGKRAGKAGKGQGGFKRSFGGGIRRHGG